MKKIRKDSEAEKIQKLMVDELLKTVKKLTYFTIENGLCAHSAIAQVKFSLEHLENISDDHEIHEAESLAQQEETNH